MIGSLIVMCDTIQLCVHYTFHFQCWLNYVKVHYVRVLCTSNTTEMGQFGVGILQKIKACNIVLAGVYIQAWEWG